ncbi:mRNA triphosphatase CET1 [Gonapodya prolifera JEL478]|uniref:mRNA-capping enzyme subunit beta n=1 Tax=Gonapodya prolifera (strain JEL478) TaxID=1344416 RepID=A0A139AWY2_GONPJ|nr:mRNA triphosphatase CET1 [Gonapodya prolifera JEL478]|eukprot:KXS20985.1 mRNA triphosphatase CET1 [Gonapodya prolifera JEL478]
MSSKANGQTSGGKPPTGTGGKKRRRVSDDGSSGAGRTDSHLELTRRMSGRVSIAELVNPGENGADGQIGRGPAGNLGSRGSSARLNENTIDEPAPASAAVPYNGSVPSNPNPIPPMPYGGSNPPQGRGGTPDGEDLSAERPPRPLAPYRGTPPATQQPWAAPRPIHQLAHSFQTIFGDEYFVDDITRRVTTWLYEKGVAEYPDVEVEVKLGTIRYRDTHQQLDLPVDCETIIHSGFDACYFESAMSAEQHKRFNATLNRRVEMLDPRKNTGYKGPLITYRHFTELDKFHEVNHQRIRVTFPRNRKQGDDPRPRVIQKVRLGDLNIYCPNWGLDYRISVSREMKAQFPPQSSYPVDVRLKDRLSYTCPPYSVDLTAVNTYRHEEDVPADGTEKLSSYSSYELEVELQNPYGIFVHGNEPAPEGLLRWQAGAGVTDPSGASMRTAYEAVRGLLNQARLLARRALPRVHQERHPGPMQGSGGPMPGSGPDYSSPDTPYPVGGPDPNARVMSAHERMALELSSHTANGLFGDDNGDDEGYGDRSGQREDAGGAHWSYG